MIVTQILGGLGQNIRENFKNLVSTGRDLFFFVTPTLFFILNIVYNVSKMKSIFWLHPISVMLVTNC